MVETFKAFDHAALQPPPPPLSSSSSQQDEDDDAARQRDHQEKLWLYQQRIDSLIAQFDPRYDRILAEDTRSRGEVAATKKKLGHVEKADLPRSRLQRLRACIKSAYLCKGALCFHVMQGATLAGLHHPELWHVVDMSVLSATRRMSVGASSAAAGLLSKLGGAGGGSAAVKGGGGGGLASLGAFKQKFKGHTTGDSGTVNKVERQERMWTLMEASAYDDSLEAVAAETSRWLEDKQVASSSPGASDVVDAASSLGIVPVYRVSRSAFLQIISSTEMLSTDDGQFGRSLSQIIFENEHNLMLSDPPVCIPGPLEQLLAIPPSMRDAGTVKAIAISLSCLPFFQGFSPAAAAAAAAHITCATVMANHVVALQGEREYFIPNGQRIVEGAWGGGGCGGSETLDSAEGCMCIMLVVRGCISVRQSQSNPDVRLWAAAKNIKGSNTLKNLCKAAFGEETAIVFPGDVRPNTYRPNYECDCPYSNVLPRCSQKAMQSAAVPAHFPP